MNRFLFKDRDGRTPLPADFKKGLTKKYRSIQVSKELDEVEEENIVEGLLWLDDSNENPQDWMFWKKLHKKLFGQVWSWAGSIRTIELADPDFNHPGTILENLKKLEQDLVYWLSNLDKDGGRESIAKFHERFLTIHPFTNGNGRTSRILTDYICKKSGLQLPDWGKHHQKNQKVHRSAYIEALLEARKNHNYQDLIAFMYGEETE